MFKIICLMLGVWVLIPTFVSADQAVGVAKLAGNLLEPIAILSDFVGTASLIIGASFIFAAIVKYIQHRANPLFVPISTVVILAIMGVILVALPFTYYLTDGGVPYTFFR